VDIAINKKNEEVFAENANYDIYFCTECGELAFLRRPNNKHPHFYHIKYNEKCSLSVKSNNEPFSFNVMVEKAYNILQNDYSQRWIEAINDLIKYDCLFRLYGKEWAISPINLYINYHIENIEEQLFYEFLHIISGINNLRAFKLLLNYISFSILNQENREILEKNI
jgi:hypothetical protein